MSTIKLSSKEVFLWEFDRDLAISFKKVSAITTCPLYSMSAIDTFDCNNIIITLANIIMSEFLISTFVDLRAQQLVILSFLTGART